MASRSVKRQRSSRGGKSTLVEVRERDFASLLPLARRSRAAIPKARAFSEPGFVDLAAAQYDLDSDSATIALLNTVPQGAGTSQRVGKRIMLKSLQGRGLISSNSTTTNSDVAFMVVYDKRPIGTLPAVTDILNTATSASFNNDTNSGRFRILKRVNRVVIGGGVSANLTAKSAHTADFFLNLRGLPQVFKAAGTGAIGDIEEGALYLITVGNTPNGTASPALTMGFRLRYHDV